MVDLAWYADPTLQTVAVAGAIIGAISGALGVPAYLRRESLIGDVIAHSTLLGIIAAFVLSYWVTGDGKRTASVLLPGAIIGGLLASATLRWIERTTRLKPDAGLGVLLAIFFATAMVGLHVVQRSDPAIPNRAGLDTYLFGMAAATTRSDLITIAGLGGVSVVVMTLLWCRLKLFAFDPLYGRSLGIAPAVPSTVLSMLSVLGIVVGLQTVGVILMTSMLIAPAAAARQWTRGVGSMTLLASAIGAGSAAIGAVISGVIRHLPTGPVIVLVLTVIVAVSILLAPGRGLLWPNRSTSDSIPDRPAIDGPIAGDASRDD